MCYDVAFKTNIKTIQDYFPGIKVENQLLLNFHDLDHIQAQGNLSYGIVVKENGIITLENMLWAGKVNRGGQRVWNARSETILERNSLWYIIRKNRCLIPVTGVYEHREIAGWKKKVPYYIGELNREVFYIPGLYDDGNIVDTTTREIPRTFILLTRKANWAMSQIHNANPQDPRMPLFLTPELELKWLSENLTDEEIKEITNYEIKSEDLKYHPVDTIRSRKPRADGKSKDAPLEWKGLPAIAKL